MFLIRYITKLNDIKLQQLKTKNKIKILELQIYLSHNLSHTYR